MAVHTPRRVRPEGWGLPIGTGVGAGLGLVVGVLLGQIALGLSVGAALGLVVGATATTAHRTPEDRRRVVLASVLAICAAGAVVILLVWLS